MITLSNKTVAVVMVVFITLLMLIFPFVQPDRTLDGYQERGMVTTNDGTVHRFFDKVDE
jgi:hypothetical protein